MEEMKIFEGRIEAIAKREGSFGLKISNFPDNKGWLNVPADECPFEKNDIVRFSYKIGSFGAYAKIEDIKITAEGKEESSGRVNERETFNELLEKAIFTSLSHKIIEEKEGRIKYTTVIEGYGKRVEIDQIQNRDAMTPQQQKCFESVARTFALKYALAVFTGTEIEKNIEEDIETKEEIEKIEKDEEKR